MTEYVKTATQFLIEARRWQLETIKEQTAAADALLKQQKAQLEERDHILRDLKRQLKRKKALVDIARSYTLCLDKKVRCRHFTHTRLLIEFAPGQARRSMERAERRTARHAEA